MAREPRLCAAGIPCHIIQRGNNREPIFFSEDDYSFFLEVIREAKSKYPCFIYGYCLMTNHFHLLAEPKEADNLSLFMKLLGAKYVRYINKIHKRTGTLWQGRFKCSLIEEELYFLACLHYIEMNPLRAGMVSLPEAYRWSSYRVRAFGEKSPVVDLDPWYNGLGNDNPERQIHYRNFFQRATPDLVWKLIREMTAKNAIVGSDKFREKIESVLSRKIVFRQPGRPKKEEK
jgi:putative transposase